MTWDLGFRKPLVVAFVALLLALGMSGWAEGSPSDPLRVPTNRPLVAGLSAHTGAFTPDVEPPGSPDNRERKLRRPTPPEPTSPKPSLLAAVPRELPITARPGGGKVIGQMPAGSRFYNVPLKAWIMERTKKGRYGRVTVPYSGSRATGWIRLSGLELSHTPYSVEADISRHLVTVRRFDEVIMRFSAATGAAGSPTPPGRYFVTDRVAIDPGGSFGTYAFGISGIQPNLPPGWTGGDQMAIHGTNDPSSIGTSASAGCLRVSTNALKRMKPVLRLGTPVEIQP